MSVNPISHLLELPSDEPVIALYQSLNTVNDEISDFLVIHTEGFVIELNRVESPRQVEYRTVYDIAARQVIAYVIFPGKSVLFYQISSFDAYLGEGNSTEEADSENRRVVVVRSGDTQRYTLTLSEGIPNIHHSTLFFKEIDTLPLRIEEKDVRRTFHAFLTDANQKRGVLESLRLDLDSYLVLDQDDVETLSKEMFGVSYEQLLTQLGR